MFSIKDPKNLWYRYLLAIILIFSFITISHIYAFYSTVYTEELSSTINLSGRQRMLSQRILYYATYLKSDPENKKIQSELINTINLFERSHETLSTGTGLKSTASLSPEFLAFYFQPTPFGSSLDNQIKEFIGEARRVAQGGPGAAIALEKIQEIGSTQLLTLLNDAVTSFENQAKESVQTIRYISNFGYWTATLIMILEIFFIFLPAHRLVINTITWFEEAMAKRVASEKSAKAMEQKARTAQLAAEEAADAKATFVANMSHEIRTPLNAVIGFSGLALSTQLTPQQRDYIQKIKSSSSVLLNVVNDVLDISKIDTNQIELENNDFNLDEVITTITAILSSRAAEKSLEFLIKVNPDVPLNLFGDSLRLGQIFINLADNAIKFTNEGDVLIEVDAELKQDDAVRLICKVTDTGIGMSEDASSPLFSPFMQADASPTRRYGGAGLGLTIVRHLIEMMNGTLSLESDVSIGTTFHFTVDLKRSAKVMGTRLVPPRDIRQTRILLADDNDMARQILTETLEAMTFDVTATASGEDLIEALKQNSALKGDPFGLIIVDWKMPGLDGIETSSIVLKDSLQGPAPKIVLLTAFGLDSHRDRAIKAGITRFLTKPINQSALYDEIVNILTGQPLDQHASPKPITRNTEAILAVQGAHMLVAEDNDLNQQVITEMLRQAGVGFSLVPNGVKAVEAIMMKKQHYDGVLMDIQMPEMDGFEATRQIRNIPEAVNLPIIAMTAHAMKGHKIKCLASGMNDHISKPIDPDRLFQTIAKWLPHPKKQTLKTDTSISARSNNGMVQQPQLGSSDDENFSKAENEQSLLNNTGYSLSQTSDLPDHIDGLDIEQGLKSLMGNREIYRDLLINFVEQYFSAETYLGDMLSSEKEEEALRYVHSIKGVSGNLGAMSLFKASGDLELAFKNSAKDQALQSFNATVRHIMDPLKAFFDGTSVPASSAEADFDLRTNRKVLRGLVQKLKTCLRNGNIFANTLILDISKQSDLKYKTVLEDIYRDIQDLEFDTALEKLQIFEETVFIEKQTEVDTEVIKLD